MSNTLTYTLSQLTDWRGIWVNLLSFFLRGKGISPRNWCRDNAANAGITREIGTSGRGGRPCSECRPVRNLLFPSVSRGWGEGRPTLAHLCYVTAADTNGANLIIARRGPLARPSPRGRRSDRADN